jgi:hypothetical protein
MFMQVERDSFGKRFLTPTKTALRSRGVFGIRYHHPSTQRFTAQDTECSVSEGWKLADCVAPSTHHPDVASVEGHALEIDPSHRISADHRARAG